MFDHDILQTGHRPYPKNPDQRAVARTLTSRSLLSLLPPTQCLVPDVRKCDVRRKQLGGQV